MTIFQVYTATTYADDEAAAHFYGQAQSAVDRTCTRMLLVIKDWNAKVGNIKNEQLQSIIELYGLGSKNSPGEGHQFLPVQCLFTANKVFKQQNQYLYTSMTPEMEYAGIKLIKLLYKEVEEFEYNSKDVSKD